jgi:hypothetical protein
VRSGLRVEQVILTRERGLMSALVVLEAPSGARTRERWPALAPDPEAAVDRLAVQLARRGDVDGPRRRLRVRVGAGEALRDREDLSRRLGRRLERELAADDGDPGGRSEAS